jgi:nicotinate-nucleotide adenylyltransferase
VTPPAAERIGVFGGQFDPPHNGHLAVARAAVRQLDLDGLLVVPAARPPHRPEPETPAEVRYELARAAFADQPGVEVSRIELDRDGPSYTADTLAALARPGRRLYLIVGADQLAALDGWHRPDRVRELATIAVAGRPGAPRADGVAVLAMEPVDASSSGIRERVARGDDVSALVPPGVAAAIARDRLYHDG